LANFQIQILPAELSRDAIVKAAFAWLPLEYSSLMRAVFEVIDVCDRIV
jgi:hypothetical protein